MIHQEFWTPRPHWTRYALGIWKGIGRVEELHDDSPERAEFMECARASFTESGLAVVRLRTWVNVQMPCPGEGYDAGYPHIHANTAGTTMVHYLDPGDVPAPLDIFDGEEVIETIYPEAGKTVYIPNGIKHGVRKNQGDLPRVAFIATAYSM